MGSEVGITEWIWEHVYDQNLLYEILKDYSEKLLQIPVKRELINFLYSFGVYVCVCVCVCVCWDQFVSVAKYLTCPLHERLTT